MASTLPLILIVGLYFGACELVEYLAVRRQAAEVFPPKFGWRLLRWAGIAGCIAGIAERLHGSAGPSSWALWLYVLLLLFWLCWPRTVLVDSSAVSSCSLFGF